MNTVRIITTLFLLLGVFSSTELPSDTNISGASIPPLPTRLKADPVASYLKLPITFVANEGQTDARVRFVAQTSGVNFYFTSSETVFIFARKEKGVVLRLQFIGANPNPAIIGAHQTAARINYLMGQSPLGWHKGVSNYEKVIYRDLWPGIDLVFGSENTDLKYEFHVAAGADPNNISLAYRGSKRLSLDRNGNLRIRTSLGTLKDRAPVSFQIVDGVRVPVASSYRLTNGKYGFKLGSYDASCPVVIDPLVESSTYLGGAGSDQAFGIAVDVSANTYITGVTAALNFPTTAGAFDTNFNGGNGDAFVTKITPSGLEYSTYLGGIGNDEGNGIAVDSTGSAYITGSTASSDFPTTPAAFDAIHNGPTEAFVTRLSADGSTLMYSSFLGGSLAGCLGGAANDEGSQIAVDNLGSAYVVGTTSSRNFPTTPGAFDTIHSNTSCSTIFLTKVNADGSALIYSTFLGESGKGNAIAVATDGSAYVTGNATPAGFPTTPGAFDTTGKGSDVFVTKFNAGGTGLLYSTFLSGSLSDTANGIAADTDGNAYVTGFTDSSDYPTTPGAFDTTTPAANIGQAFVTKLNSEGSALVYSTYLGGSARDECHGIAVDQLGNVYVAGQTASTNFPTTPGPFDPTSNGLLDGFLSKLNASGSALIYSTYFGGGGNDVGRAVAVDNFGSINVTGSTTSNNFPVTTGAFDTTFNGSVDTFLIKLINEPPNATADEATTDEDNAAIIHVLGNDTDLDGDQLSLDNVTQGANGSVTLNADNTVTYLPALNFNGLDSFSYTVVDTYGNTDIATVTLTINPVNDAPVAGDDSYSTSANTPLALSAPGVLSNDTDVEDNDLSAIIVTSVSNGTLTLAADGSFTYTPNPNFSGLDSFTYRAFDGADNSNAATAQITVAAAPTPTPTPTPPPACKQEGQCFVFEYLGNATAANGETTITFMVTNKCKNAVRMIAIGTDGFTRITPTDGSVYNGTLGSYDVGWTRASGNPGFVGIKFEPTTKNYKSGASDVFSVVVTNFNSNTIIPVKGVGQTQETFTFQLSETSCLSSTANSNIPQATTFSKWIGDFLSRLIHFI